MTNPQRFLAVLTALCLLPVLAFGQTPQSYHAGSILLDDGSGHSIIINPPTTGVGLQTFSFPTGGGTVATTTYVSSQLGSYLPLAGGTMSGDIGMGTHNISGVSTLTATSFVGALTGNASTATTAGNITGTVAIANGGTGQTTQATALTALLPAQGAGTSGQVLTSNGSAASWQASSGGSSTHNFVRSTTASYTILTTDDVVEYDGSASSLTWTFPSAASFGTGHVLYIINNSTAVPSDSFVPNGSDQFMNTAAGGYSVGTVSHNGFFFIFISDGVSKWIRNQ